LEVALYKNDQINKYIKKEKENTTVQILFYFFFKSTKK